MVALAVSRRVSENLASFRLGSSPKDADNWASSWGPSCFINQLFLGTEEGRSERILPTHDPSLPLAALLDHRSSFFDTRVRRSFMPTVSCLSSRVAPYAMHELS